MLKINIKTTNFQLTDSIREYIEKKFGELEKFVSAYTDDNGRRSTIEAFVEVGRTTQHHKKGDVYKAEVQIRLPGAQGIRSVSERWDIHQAIDEARDEMQRQLNKYKGKRRSRFYHAARLAKRLTKISPLARFRREKEK
jgi:ribosomal subunit interface protein